jgi:hypothetical protein
MKHFFGSLFLFLFFASGYGQTASEDFKSEVDSLGTILFSDATDEVKNTQNKVLEERMYDFLLREDSRTFTYDSLRFIKYLKPENASFALISWVIPLIDYTHLYSGFIQKWNPMGVDTIIRLQPETLQIEPDKSYDAGHWPAAVYYQIIADENADFYTLFGWVGKPRDLAGKIIETLGFDSTGMPVFGRPVFSMKDGSLQSRVEFEFTNQIPFHLAYELQALPPQKTSEDWMIVFNRLTGNSAGMGRMFYGPVPSYDVFDGFARINGKWVFFEDIDPRVEFDVVDPATIKKSKRRKRQ